MHLQCAVCQDLAIQHRSKGDPPINLIQRLMKSQYLSSGAEENDQVVIDFRPSQILMKSEGVEDLDSDNAPWHPGPFRDSPFLEPVSTEDPKEGASGISITVDDRTFDTLGMAVNKNMGRLVKSAAKDLRSAVDGAAKFMGESLKATLAAKRRPTSENGLLGFLGLSSTKSTSNASGSSSYGVPKAPVLTTSPSPPIYVSSTPTIPPATTPNPVYQVSTPNPVYQVSTISSDYGVPRAPPVTSSQNSFNTNFHDVRDNYVNDIGPSIASLQEPVQANYDQQPNIFRPLNSIQHSTTKNPFLRTTTTVSPSTTPLPPFAEPIYRPKRGKKKRPGIPPVTARPTPVEPATKDRDFKEVKKAWYNYYRKAKDYTRKYREKVDVGVFKLEAAAKRNKKHIRNTTPRPLSLSGKSTPGALPKHRRPPNLTPGPFSGKTRLQLPFAQRPKHPTKVPLFTLPILRSSPKPSPRPSRPRTQRLSPAALNFNSLEPTRRKSSKKSEMTTADIDILRAPTAMEMSYEILTPLSDIDKSSYYDEDYYFYEDEL